MESLAFESFVHGEVFPARIILDASDAARDTLERFNNASTDEILTPFLGSYAPINFFLESPHRKIAVESFRAKPVDVRVLNANATKHGLQGTEPLSYIVYEENARKSDHCNSGLLAVPWIQRWFTGVLNKCSFSSHEAIDQPVSSIFLVSTCDLDQVAELERMKLQLKSNVVFLENRLDNSFPAAYVLVHDLSSDKLSNVDAKSIFDSLVSAFGADNCFYLPANNEVNCRIDAIQEGIFKVATSSEKYQSISWTQVHALKNLGESVVRNLGAPWMLMKLEILDAHISSKKRGLRNQFKSFWKRAGGVEDSGRRVDLTLAHVEWECRLAGDLAFHLRDYGLAADLYRSIASEMKHEGLLAVSAGSYEMLAVCNFLCGLGQGDVDRSMDLSIELYLKQIPLVNPSLVRAMVLYTLIQTDLFQAAAHLDQGNSNLSNLAGVDRAALHESVSVLYARAGCMRKSAFQLVLAGHTYRESGLRDLALKCYRDVALDVEGSSWMNIEDHIHFSLAKQLFASGDIDGCVNHFSSLFSDIGIGQQINRVSVADKQGNYLKGLLSVWKTSRPKTPLDMTIPRFSFPSAIFQGSTRIMRVTGSVIDIEVWNPLLIPLELSDLTLQVQGSGFDASLIDTFLLPPNSIVRKQLSINVRQCGIFDSCCIRWLLNGVVNCKQNCAIQLDVDAVSFNICGLPAGPVPFGGVLTFDICVSSSVSPLDVAEFCVEDLAKVTRLRHTRKEPGEISIRGSVIIDTIGTNTFKYVLNGREKLLTKSNPLILTVECSQGIQMYNFCFISSAEANQRLARVIIANASRDAIMIPTFCLMAAASRSQEGYDDLSMTAIHEIDSVNILPGQAVQMVFDCRLGDIPSLPDPAMSELYEYFCRGTVSSRSVFERLKNHGNTSCFSPTLFHIGLFWNSVAGFTGLSRKVTEDSVRVIQIGLEYPAIVMAGDEFKFGVSLSCTRRCAIHVSEIFIQDSSSADYIYFGKTRTFCNREIATISQEVMNLTVIVTKPGVIKAPVFKILFTGPTGLKESEILDSGRFVIAK